MSTRGGGAPKNFTDILLSGLAADGGLFMPEAWPRISRDDIASFAQRSYPSVATEILCRFAAGCFSSEEVAADVNAAYASFEKGEVAPLVEIGPDLYLLELFHGPTLAFKDVAMQVLGRFFARALGRRGDRATVVVATSGDTGSAAVAALGSRPNVDLFVLYPHGRISEVQRRQMTATQHRNVHTVALEGTFDDAQAIVKALFADDAFARAAHLTAVNSINFARIAAQSVYYFTAAARLGTAPVFVVPTGNFGDVFAGEAARRMGLPISRLVVATNANDILARALERGVYEAGTALPSLSPSMDIQVASNFERALYEASGRNVAWLGEAMTEFGGNHKLQIPSPVLRTLQSLYAAFRADDDETLKAIEAVYKQTGHLIDPHTAVGVAVAQKFGSQSPGPKIVLSTAHPAKFPGAVVRATGRVPNRPAQLSELYSRSEKMDIIPASLPLVRAYIEARLAHHET